MQHFRLHPTHPQQRLLQQTAQLLQTGGLVALPSDACYTMICMPEHTSSIEKLRSARNLGPLHPLTLVVRDLSELSRYARMDNAHHQLLRRLTPGPYTVLLKATKEVPKRLSDPKRKVIGIRIPDSEILQSILRLLDGPVLSTSLIPPGQTEPLQNAEEIREKLAKKIDLVVDTSETQGALPTTIIDLTSFELKVIRVGRGSIEKLTR